MEVSVDSHLEMKLSKLLLELEELKEERTQLRAQNTELLTKLRTLQAETGWQHDL